MICPNCKNRVPDDEETCPLCGASLKGGAQSGSVPHTEPKPTGGPPSDSSKSDPYAGWGNAAPSNAKPPKKSKVPLIVGIVALVAIVIGVVAAFVLPKLGPGGNPSADGTNSVPPASDAPIDYKPDVANAFVKSIETYSSAGKAMIPEDVRTMVQTPGHSADLAITLNELSGIPNLSIDPSLLSSMGLRLSTDVNLETETIAAELAASYGSAELLSLQAGLVGNTLSLSVPAITGDTFYGVDTSTIGPWLVSMFGVDQQYSTLSIQPFVILNTAKDAMEDLEAKYGTAAMSAAITGAVDKVWDAVEVEIIEGEPKAIGNASCTGYTVTVPEKALEDLVDTIYSLPTPVLQDIADPLTEIVHSLGLPQDVQSQFDDSLANALSEDSTAQIDENKADTQQQVKDFLQRLGDITVQVWIADGYVMELDWAKTVDTTTLDCTATFGGGDRYVDDVTVTVHVAYEAPDPEQEGPVSDRQSFQNTIALVSKGDHTAAEGVYTDETVLTITNDATGEAVSLSSNLRYEPKSEADPEAPATDTTDPNAEPDNFQWTLTLAAPDGTSLDLNAKGEVRTGPDSISVSLGELALTSGDMRLSVSLDFSLRPYTERIQLGDPVILNNLSEEEMNQVVQSVVGNLAQFVLQLLYTNPAFSNLLSQLGLGF